MFMTPMIKVLVNKNLCGLACNMFDIFFRENRVAHLFNLHANQNRSHISSNYNFEAQPSSTG
jgi:hypothetical protein